MRFVNLTRQDIRIVPDNGVEIVIPSSGLVYVSETNSLDVMHDDKYGLVPVTTVTSEVVNAPNKVEGVAYVVNWKTLQAMRANGFDVSDVYCPDAALRDGVRITGSRRLIRYLPS